MRLRVDANGNKLDKGTLVSIFDKLLPGEHDDQLNGPFKGKLLSS